MFTGIVEAVGKIVEAAPIGNGRRLRIAASFAPEVAAGDSVAVEGVCLTADAPGEATFDVEAIATTLSRTTLGALEPGGRVNLERALALGDRLGGHLVQGHVDGVGEVVSVEREAEQVLLELSLPPEVADVTVLHGSITVAGVSLTVNALPAPDMARVALIPYTWNHTTLRELRPGDGVNLEGDMLGRFVVSYLQRSGRGGRDE
ncbi:MAG TPA: riboflavin synthase [Longimicrobiales bacterium]|nr:riboflavin synthase [Longimicrobiales bacterium]